MALIGLADKGETDLDVYNPARVILCDRNGIECQHLRHHCHCRAFISLGCKYRPLQPLLSKSCICRTKNRNTPNGTSTYASIFDVSSKSLDNCLAEPFELFKVRPKSNEH